MSVREEIRQVHCESGTITYSLARKPVKNVNMRIKEDGRVCVSASPQVPIGFIDAWVREKQAFIRRAQAQYRQRRRRAEKQAEQGSFQKGDRLSEEQAQVFQDMVDAVYIKFQRKGRDCVPYPKVKLRYMTSRWGSCQPATGKITLNSRLIAAPEGCLEYVVVHEFAHFIEANHSRAFWDVVGEFLPDFKERRRRLREWDF